jgi:hypothetical protein
MTFMRPEVAAALSRWRETLIGAGVGALGLWWALKTFGVLAWLGWALVVIGAALALAGVQRARFRRGRGGPGVVQVDEGQIAYFGPLTGGLASLTEVTLLSLDCSGSPAHWLLRQPGQPDLAIPVTAEGADALFDTFAALPGLSTTKLLATLDAAEPHPVVIWRKASLRLH